MKLKKELGWKTCATCNHTLYENWFNLGDGTQCSICVANSGISIKTDKPKDNIRVEVVEDKGCAGGACTL